MDEREKTETEKEKICWWMWSSQLWFGPVQRLVVLQSGCGLCGLGSNEQGNKLGQGSS